MANQTADIDGKQKALSMVLNQIERTFGKGAIMRLGDATRMRVETMFHRSADFGSSLRWRLTQGESD